MRRGIRCPASPSAGHAARSVTQFNTITGADWKRSLASARSRRKTTTTRITMQSFLSELGDLVPGVSFKVLANVGAGRVPAETVPADKLPPAVDVRASWTSACGRTLTADLACATSFLLTNPKLSAQSCANRLEPIMKGGAS